MRWVVAVALLGLGCAKKAEPEPAVVQVEAEPEPEPELSIEERINQAAALIETGDPGDLATAVGLLSDAIEEDESGAARYNLALARHAQGDYATAAMLYETAVQENATDAEAWLHLAEVRTQTGRSSSAEENLRLGLRYSSDNLDLRVALIRHLRNEGRLDDAIEASKAALKINANHLPIYNNFALAYLDKGDTTLARFILQKALQSVEGAVNNATLHTNLGWSYYLDGNKPAAKESLEKALEIEPELVPALMYLSRVYLDDRNYEDMVPLLETAKDVDPTNADVQLTLGIAYRGVERLDDARKAYEQALVLRPTDPTPHFNLGILLGDYEKDYDGAIAAFQRYVDSTGPDADRARQYIEDVTKEKKRAERRARSEAKRLEREAERARQQAMVEEEQADESAPSTDDVDVPPVADGDDASPEAP